MNTHTEAARVTALILSLVTALVAITGVVISPDQLGAIEVFVGALVLILVEFGVLEWLRGKVFSKQTVDKLVDGTEDGTAV